VQFEYGISTAYGSAIAADTVPSGAGSTNMAANLTNLSCGTTYYYRITASNSAGTTAGSDQFFATNACPVVNGACGSANGGSFSLAPSANLCASGTPSIIPSGTGPWTWFCTGTTGLGTNASCRAELNASTTVITGTNVAATPTPAVSLNFSSVTTSGLVQVLSSTGPGANLTIADGTLFNTIPGTSYDITTTAGINGMTTVCVSYDPLNVPANTESLLRLLHYNGTTWTDISLLPVDTANHRVCGQTATLSPFVIGYSTSSGSGGAAPVPALNPMALLAACTALCGILWRRKR
jgi:hypothetical protein